MVYNLLLPSILSWTCTECFHLWLLSLVQIVATGVCHTDLYHLFEGMHKDGFPAVLGHEGAGIVESIGPGVTEFQPGQLKFRMAVFSFLVWHSTKQISFYMMYSFKRLDNIVSTFQVTKSSLCSSPSVDSVAFVKVPKPTSVRGDGWLTFYHRLISYMLHYLLISASIFHIIIFMLMFSLQGC